MQADTLMSDIDLVLDRHKAFWELETVEMPLVQCMNFAGYQTKPYPALPDKFIFDPAKILPGDIDVCRLLGLNKPEKPVFDGCKVNCLGPVFPEAWMEALIGCDIYASAFSCSAKPVTNDINKFVVEFDIDAALKSPWLSVMDDVIKTAINSADGRIGVRQLHMRGLIDMVAACLGEEAMCLEMCDNAERVKSVVSQFSELYMEVAARGLKMRPMWNQGYVSTWGLFAPGTLLDYQVDASNMISGAQYEDIFLHYDESIIETFDYSIVHIHSCGLHIIDSLIKIDKLRAIEINLDRETGVYDAERIIEYCRKIQSVGKSVLLYGQLSEPELDRILQALSFEGLAIFYWQ